MNLKQWLKSKIKEVERQKKAAIVLRWYQSVADYESVLYFLKKELEILEQ